MLRDRDSDHLDPAISVIWVRRINFFSDEIVFGNFEFDIAMRFFFNRRQESLFTPASTYFGCPSTKKSFWFSRAVYEKAFLNDVFTFRGLTRLVGFRGIGYSGGRGLCIWSLRGLLASNYSESHRDGYG